MTNINIDCDCCVKAKLNGGKCNRFQYICPFDILETFNESDIKLIRRVVNNINISIGNLKVIDENHDIMDHDIEALENALVKLKERLSIDLQKEWKEINED